MSINDEEFVTSQLVFDDALSDAIVASEPIYSDRGPRDTNNTNDSVVPAGSAGDYTLRTERMVDGVMLAWKTLVIRSSAADALCSVGGGAGPMRPGG